MIAETADTIATALFTAAGRNCGDAEKMVWRAALDRSPETGALDALNTILREVDLGARGAPTPALFISTHRAELKARQAREQPALPVPWPDAPRENVARLREMLAAAPIARPVPELPAEVERPPSPRRGQSCCAEEDHSRCGAGPARAR